MINRVSQRRYVREACTILEDAQQATSLDECNRLLGVAAEKLESAEERPLAALVRDIKEGRAYVSLIPTIVNGLARSYDLLPSA